MLHVREVKRYSAVGKKCYSFNKYIQFSSCVSLFAVYVKYNVKQSQEMDNVSCHS